ncbi:MAG: hypothetical protein GX364_02910 [Firmicutes bacterium]|jgi:hypothetical protein|nr:hypothetical protein [Bacillota bacterium]
MKKISMILVFCMVLGLLFSSVAAQEPVKLVISSVEGKAGEEVEVDFSLSADVKIAGLKLMVNYNADFMELVYTNEDDEEYVEQKALKGTLAANADTPGILDIASANATDFTVKANNVLFTLKFKIIEGSELTDSNVWVDIDDDSNEFFVADGALEAPTITEVVQGSVSLEGDEDENGEDENGEDENGEDENGEDENGEDDAKEDAKSKKGSQMMPFMLLGGLLTLIGAVMIMPFRKLRRQ